MKVLKISKIIDFVFGTAVLFLISFVWTRYFLHDTWLTILISSIITFVVATIYHFISKTKKQKIELTNKEIKNAKQIATGFLLSTKQEILKTFYEKFNVKYNTKIKSDFLLVNDKVLKPIYSTQTITDREILEAYLKVKDISAKKIIITCQNADTTAYNFCKLVTDKEILILTEFEAYTNIFKPLNFDVPEIKATPHKKNAQYYLSLALNKSRTKNYLIVSAFMLFASFILRYNIYYLTFASITGLLALYSHFNTRYNKPYEYI